MSKPRPQPELKLVHPRLQPEAQEALDAKRAAMTGEGQMEFLRLKLGTNPEGATARALSDSIARSIDYGKSAQEDRRKGGEATAGDRRVAAARIEAKIYVDWHKLSEVDACHRVAAIARRVERSPQHVYRVLRKLNIAKRRFKKS